ncbi:aldo/keto reductase [Nocardia alni]|uniref:aldo/keto reductase n=1 Tax=Nocardia alni TaxID=2815723 RepID=UPI001C2489D3|nr:aldo/keto reductase [Nocardia alni]
MLTRTLGRSDTEVSRLGLGTATWGLTTDAADAAAQVKLFADAGGTLLGTADVYGVDGRAEEIIGGILGTTIARSEVVIATKAGGVGGPRSIGFDASAKHLLAALDGSLRRLGTDHVDIWQVHAWDSETALAETLAALDTAVTSGRVGNIGVSNYSGWQLGAAAEHQIACGGAPLASVEAEYSLLSRGIEREIIPAAAHFEIGVLAWAPLGRGVLTGKYRDEPRGTRTSGFFRRYVEPLLLTPNSDAVVDAVRSTAAALGVPPPAVALAWVRDRPGVASCIVGARTSDQLRQILLADGLSLPPEAAEQLDLLSVPPIGYPERSFA